MKQEEKTQKTRERILRAAIEEFGTKSYETASLNMICSNGCIPKGLFYHNFQNKDDLYLQCVKICYDKMTEYLKAKKIEFNDVKKSLEELLTVRQNFFSEYPYYANIFFNSILQPPKHLLDDLQIIRKEFDEFCTTCYRTVLRYVSLREGITEKMALEYFSLFLEMFNGYFQKKADQSDDYRTLIEGHEGALSKILDVMLYGIAKQ